MPKQRITKEMVVEAAFEIAREEGIDKVIVKKIAARLGCSVQPIYSYCLNMDGLKQEVTARTGVFIREYLSSHVNREDRFRSMGEAQIRLAKEEPNLFKLYFMRKRQDIHSLEDIYEKESSPQIAAALMETLHIDGIQARALHLHMIIYTMGISAILATSEADIPNDSIILQMESAYKAFLKQIKEKE